MKKTILATAILLAGAANAAEVYNNEGTTVSLGGSFRGNVVIADSDNVNFQDAGSRFDIKAVKELDDGVKAFGQMEIKYNGKDGDTLFVNKAFVGFEHDVYGKLVLGKKLGLNDDLVMNDFSYENGVYSHQDAAAGSDTQDQLEYTKTFGGASVVVGLIDQDTYSIGGTYEVAGLSLGLAYNIKNDADAAGSDNSALIVGAQYALDALTLGAQYQTLEVADVDTSAYGIGVHYALGQAGVYAMYDILEVAKVDGSELVIGADYEIVKDVKTYVEFNSSDSDAKANSDETVWLGARVYF
ncbi:porin [Moritella viscosa]|uniref:Outer membrane protein n=1 Tax=Moritella viscosa TaxID=80854 RepID=A0A1L0AMA2_9GAMM|nr:porin [Moritella viscosa]SGY85916.1 Outer membrane protein [Moritella viscosa]SGY87193.1 Outer membrane protein [Moritella viscosa]SGY88704.1 Outer membrane protein [Moritella viscosa]SGY89195.1 Outer membrane protein [Moritella viscosa]SHO00395.1 Outer membrane protein [Moritella viscosa]